MAEKLRVLFWNFKPKDNLVKQKDKEPNEVFHRRMEKLWNETFLHIFKYIATTLSPELIVLAEPDNLKNDFSSTNEIHDLFTAQEYKPLADTPLNIWTKYNNGDLELLDAPTHHPELTRLKILKFKRTGLQPFLLMPVHLIDKGNADSYVQLREAIMLKDDIRIIEENHIDCQNRTIVFGDFNMNPFDPGMIDVAGFHAIMDLQLAKEKSKPMSVQKRHYRETTFYNPMWKYLGGLLHGQTTIFGTYRFDGQKNMRYFWNILDQVIVRPEFEKRLKKVEICIELGASLIDKQTAKPEFSDHLPIYFEIDLIANIENNGNI